MLQLRKTNSDENLQSGSLGRAISYSFRMVSVHVSIPLASRRRAKLGQKQEDGNFMRAGLSLRGDRLVESCKGLPWEDELIYPILTLYRSSRIAVETQQSLQPWLLGRSKSCGWRPSTD
jgi:hypothetical protein